MNYTINYNRPWTTEMNSDLVILKEAGLKKIALAKMLGRKMDVIDRQYDKIMKGECEYARNQASHTAKLIVSLLDTTSSLREKYKKAIMAIELMIESGEFKEADNNEKFLNSLNDLT